MQKAKLFQVTTRAYRDDLRSLCSDPQATLSLDKALEHSNVIYILVATPTGSARVRVSLCAT